MQIFSHTLVGTVIDDVNNQVKLDAFFEEYCTNTDWSVFVERDQPQPALSRHVGEYHGIDVWYCHGENYFFFTPV